MSSHSIRIAASFLLLAAAPAIAQDVPSADNLVTKLQNPDAIRLAMRDSYIFQSLRMAHGAPLGYESHPSFAAALDQFRTTVAMHERDVPQLVIRIQQDGELDTYLHNAQEAIAANRRDYDNFLTANGIDPDGPLSKGLLDGLVTYGAMAGASGTGWDMPTFIWPFCFPRPDNMNRFAN